MKKIIAVAVLGVLTAATAATAAPVTIVGSKHDLSATGTASMKGQGSSTQICIYCHAPHNASQSLPLWNRTAPAGPFTLYSGLNMANKSFKTGFTSDSTSLFCMSCHDGATAISAVYNAGVIDGTGTNKAHAAKAGAFYANPLTSSLSTSLGTDLSKTHPINFPVLNTAAADGSHALNFTGGNSYMGPVADPTQIALGYAAGTITKTFPLFKAVGHADSERQTATSSLECGSCHAVHDAQYSPFLRDTMKGSQLCLGCHNK